MNTGGGRNQLKEMPHGAAARDPDSSRQQENPSCPATARLFKEVSVINIPKTSERVAWKQAAV